MPGRERRPGKDAKGSLRAESSRLWRHDIACFQPATLPPTPYPGRRSLRRSALRSLRRVGLPWAGISRAVGPKPISKAKAKTTAGIPQSFIDKLQSDDTLAKLSSKSESADAESFPADFSVTFSLRLSLSRYETESEALTLAFPRSTLSNGLLCCVPKSRFTQSGRDRRNLRGGYLWKMPP